MHAASDALSHGLHAWPTIILAMVMLMAIGPVDAADNLWTNGAANLQWNTVTANWTSPTVWSNANVDSAIFSATGVGTLTLQSPITARALQFNTVGYTLAGTGANILTLSAGGSSVLSVGEIQSNAAVTIGAVIAGSAGLTKTGAGTLTLTATNTFSGLTTVNDGTLDLGGGGTTGSVAGNILSESDLIFNRSNGAIYGGVLSGAGTVSKLGAGTLTLTGANTGTGLFTLTTGALQLGGGGTVGNLVADIANNSSLLFNRSNAATYSGAISGAGTLTNTVHLALVL